MSRQFHRQSPQSQLVSHCSWMSARRTRNRSTGALDVDVRRAWLCEDCAVHLFQWVGFVLNIVGLFPCLCLFGSHTCRTHVKHRRDRREFWHTICCFRRVAQVFIAWMSESLVPWQLFRLFHCTHAINWHGVLFKDGLDWASLFVEVFGGCADVVIS